MTVQPIERRPALRRDTRRTRPAPAAHGTGFASLGVPAPLVAALAAEGINEPFAIQAAVLPDALAGVDILGRASTGSGKTLGFGIPLAARLAGGRTSAGRPRGLVLVPTRELASQVQEVLRPLAGAVGLSVTSIFGGTSQRPQVRALQNRADIVVACPGRLADLIGQGHCHLDDVQVTVVDEADHMADLGFLPAVRRLLDATPPGGQRMLFSATLDQAVDVLVRRFLSDPAEHSVDPVGAPAPIVHHLLTVDPAERTAVVAALTGGMGRSLIFTRTRHGARRLARQLTAEQIPAADLHGDLTQAARERNLARFASGSVRVLVATDIAARGIHVDGIDLVVHADSPTEHKAYLHRSGRTGRGGASGVVVTLQTAAQARDVRTLMRKANVVPLAATVQPGSPLLRSIAGEPAERPARQPQPDGADLEETTAGSPAAGRVSAGRGGAGRVSAGRASAGRGGAGRGGTGRAATSKTSAGRAAAGRTPAGGAAAAPSAAHPGRRRRRPEQATTAAGSRSGAGRGQAGRGEPGRTQPGGGQSGRTQPGRPQSDRGQSGPGRSGPGQSGRGQSGPGQSGRGQSGPGQPNSGK
jgi:superfamily II DNA/RNA helicase